MGIWREVGADVDVADNARGEITLFTNDDALADPPCPTFDNHRHVLIRALPVRLEVLVRRDNLHAATTPSPNVGCTPYLIRRRHSTTKLRIKPLSYLLNRRVFKRAAQAGW